MRVRNIAVAFAGAASILGAAVAAPAQAGVGHCYTFSNHKAQMQDVRICNATTPFTLPIRDRGTPAAIYLVHLRRGQRIRATLTMTNPAQAFARSLTASAMGVVSLDYWAGFPVRDIHVIGFPACGKMFGAPHCNVLRLPQLEVWGAKAIDWKPSWGQWPKPELERPTATTIVPRTGVYDFEVGDEGSQGRHPSATQPHGIFTVR